MMSPLVSIVMITYNHENFIIDAIKGVLIQKYNGSVELIIANDNSTDETDQKINDFFETNPAPENFIIKYTKHPKNKGAIPNFVWALQQATGTYVAICEGDDYWTDPLKLQKQVDFLENNQDYSLTFHKIKELTTRKEKFTYPNPDEEKTYTIQDLCKENFIITVSVVFRKNMELPDWLKYSPIGDYPMHLLNASFGLIKYFPEEMAVYRVGSGMWSTQNTVDQITNTMFALRLLLQHFKNNESVYKILFEQYNNFRSALIKPIDDKKALDSNLKDYRYIEKITSMGNVLKILKLKVAKKLNF